MLSYNIDNDSIEIDPFRFKLGPNEIVLSNDAEHNCDLITIGNDSRENLQIGMIRLEDCVKKFNGYFSNVSRICHYPLCYHSSSRTDSIRIYLKNPEFPESDCNPDRSLSFSVKNGFIHQDWIILFASDRIYYFRASILFSKTIGKLEWIEYEDFFTPSIVDDDDDYAEASAERDVYQKFCLGFSVLIVTIYTVLGCHFVFGEEIRSYLHQHNPHHRDSRMIRKRKHSRILLRSRSPASNDVEASIVDLNATRNSSTFESISTMK